MHIYAIGDLHLSGEPASKPMEVFGEHWRNHKEKVAANWQNTVTAQDTVIVCGDISWAMTLEEAAQDLDWLAQLTGRKLLLRGNHDYWWSSLSKMQQRYGAHFEFLQNDCIMVEDIAVCGTRGWPFDDAAAQGEKLMAREAGRLRMSLQAAGDTPRKIAFLHYPPVYPGASAKELVDVLQEFGVTECYYGHLHGKSIRYAVQGPVDGITYRLISADGLAFCPYKIG